MALVRSAKNHFLSFAIISLLSFNSYAQTQAEFIWAEDDNKGSRIFISQHKNGSWQPAEKIVDDGNLNILPTLGSDNKGQRLAVWSTVDGDSSLLKYSVKQGNSWQAPKILTNQMSINLAPVVVFDANDICWVFWSANNGEDDDIYVSRLKKGGWTNPQTVNEDNNVPDILPEAGQDDNGDIWVAWQQLQDNVYIEVSKSFDVASQRKMPSQKTITMQKIKQLKSRSNLDNPIQPPAFYKARSRGTMYFPNDKRRPSKPVKGNIN